MIFADIIWFSIGIVLFCLILYYAVFQAPPSDMVYQSQSLRLIKELEAYLLANNIGAYTKNATEFRSVIRGPKESSVHVINPADKYKAIKLITDKINNDRER